MKLSESCQNTGAPAGRTTLGTDRRWMYLYVEHVCGTCMWNIYVEHVCGTLSAAEKLRRLLWMAGKYRYCVAYTAVASDRLPVLVR
jgi:hypothetical protein